MIEARNVAMRSGKFELQGIHFTVPKGEYAVLMGRTGCGKTSLLEAVSGLRRVASGEIWIDGANVTSWSPADRGVGYVPQDLALFPTLTVRQHLEFAPQVRRWRRKDIEAKVQQLADVLGMKHLLDRRIQGLSGGEAQRTALGRALSFDPPVLLLDEPLSALDEATRQDMYQVLRTVKQATGVTTLHVTHSSEEAEALADLKLRIQNGQVVASG